jgi:amino acid permease
MEEKMYSEPNNRFESHNATTHDVEAYHDDDPEHLKRDLEVRHIYMIAVAGMIVRIMLYILSTLDPAMALP